MPLSFDIFCRVVDNYGDIGVCWRLARRLASLPAGGPVRLWVDDLAAFARIAPAVAPRAASQTISGIDILRWDDHAALPASCTPADVVIEAFACTPPAAYVARMSASQVWINLEYLSAEDWVESCHGLPSPQPGGLRKFFFFPGFTEGTGGLLRAPGLAARRAAWQADSDARLALLALLGVGPDWLARLRTGGARLVYVYCYPQAPLPALLDALASAGRDTLVLMPDGIWPQALPPLVGEGARVAVHTHPFVDQDTFDRLLWSSDLNVVRGEDSLVRALWAERALIWQPYPQAGDTHLEKLDAWLARSTFDHDVRDAMRAWNTGDTQATSMGLASLLRPERLQAWQAQARAWSAALRARPDLATNLASFCAEISQTR